MKKMFFTLSLALSLASVLIAQTPAKHGWIFSSPEWIAKKMFYAPDIVNGLGVLANQETPVFIDSTSKQYVSDTLTYQFTNVLRFPGPGVTDTLMPYLPVARAIVIEMNGPGYIEVLCLSTTPDTAKLLFTNGMELLHAMHVNGNNYLDPVGNQVPVQRFYYTGEQGAVFIYPEGGGVDFFYIETDNSMIIQPETVTFDVRVPEGTKGCWVAGSFNNWNPGSHQMQQVDDLNYTLTVPGVFKNSLEYKYLSGPGWTYVEKDADGEEVPNRMFQSKDTVENWLSVYDSTTVVGKRITFKVTVPFLVDSMYIAGTFNNWMMPDEQMHMEFYGPTPQGKLFGKTVWIRDVNEQIEYKFSAGKGWEFVQTQENNFVLQDNQADTVSHVVFGFYAYANTGPQPRDWNFSTLFPNQDTLMLNQHVAPNGLLIMGEENTPLMLDKSNRHNDQLWFSRRLKTGGSAVMDVTKPNAPVARAISFNTGGNCQIAIAALASNSNEVAELRISNGENLIGAIPLPGTYADNKGDVPMIIYNYQGPAGPVFLYSENAGVDFYYLGVSDYTGIPQSQDSVTYTVKVPTGTNQVCVAGEFNNWSPGMHWMNRLDSATYQLTVYGAHKGMAYKYLNGPEWGFEEVTATGEFVANRAWAELDVVEAWMNTYVQDETRLYYDDIHTMAGATIAVEMKMYSNIQSQAISYQFEAHYDTYMLEFMGYSTQGTVAETGEVVVNSTKDPGVLYISYMTAEPFDIQTSLIKLNFKVKEGGYHNQTNLWFNECFLNDQQVYNNQPGIIYIDNFMPGDVDGNFRVQAYDAALTLQFSVGKDPLPQLDPLPWEASRVMAADVDGAPGITANDAAMILQYSAYLIDSFVSDSSNTSGGMRAPVAVITDVEVVRDQQNLVFKSHGNLVGFNLYIDSEMDAFGTPVIADDISMSAVNIGDKVYAIGLVALEPMAEGVTFLTIPMLREVPADFKFSMFINSNEISKIAEAQTGIQSLADAGITLYPNPVREQMRLNNLSEGAFVRISDISGRVVIQKEINSDQDIIDVSLLSSGVYSIAIIQNKATAVSKFIKQ